MVCNGISLSRSSDTSGHGPGKTLKNFRRVNWCLASTGAWHRVGTGRVDEICQHFDSVIAKVPGTGLGAADSWFASIRARPQRCLAPVWEAGLLASRPLAAGAWHRVGGLICYHPCPVAAGAWHLCEFQHWNAGNRLGGSVGNASEFRCLGGF